MTTSPVARVQRGIPTGGQFAATNHAESDVGLTATQRPAHLEGWPESLPEPTVDFAVDSGGVVTTTVDAGEGRMLEVWVDDSSNAQFGVHGGDLWGSDAVLEDAQAWAEDKHSAIERDYEVEKAQTLKLSKARILGQHTGTRQPISDEDLEAFATEASLKRRDLEATHELACASLTARSILADHPNAHSVEIFSDPEYDRDYFDTAHVYDEAGNQIAEYGDIEDDDNERVRDMISALPADPYEAHWQQFRVDEPGPMEAYGAFIRPMDLKKAAAWAPGDQR